MRNWILLCVAMLMMVGGAADASARAVKTKRPDCRGRHLVRCARVSPASERAQLLTFLHRTETAKVRKAVHLPSLASLFGPAGAKAIALADRRIAAGAPGAKLKLGSGLAGPAAAGLEVDASSEATPVPDGKAGESLQTSDTIRNKRGVTQTRTITLMTSADRCPISHGYANRGLAGGTGNYSATFETVVPAGTERHVTRVQFRLHHDWTAVVKDDAHVSKITSQHGTEKLDVAYRFTTLDSTGKVVSEHTGGDTFKSSFDDWQHGNGVEATLYSGLASPSPLDQQAEQAATAFQDVVMASSKRGFALAEANWRTPNRCVAVALAPQTRSLAPGQSTSVTATAKPGALAGYNISIKPSGRYAARASAGSSVSPASRPEGHNARDASFRFTAPAQKWDAAHHPSLTVKLTSGGGIGESTLDLGGVEAYAYDVTVRGTGHYSETDDFSGGGSSQHETFNDPDFSFTSHWPLTVVPADGKPATPSTAYGVQATLSGSMHSAGTHTGADPSSYDCTGQLGAPPNAADDQISVGSPDATGVPLAINGFNGLSGDPSAGTCTYTGGTWWGTRTPSPGGMAVGEISAAALGHITVTSAELQQPSFTIAFGGSLGGACTTLGSNQFGRTCTHTLGWSATATFTRRFTCTRIGNGFSCGSGAAGDPGPKTRLAVAG